MDSIRRGILIVACILALPSIAHANCANPTGVKGEFFYNDDFAVMQFCDGTDWIGMSGGTGGGGAGVTDGDKGDISVSGSGTSWLIDDDLLDFTEFADALSLDASTDIAISGSQVFSLTNTGTGDSFVVNDQATDTTPFVIDAAGNVGIGLAAPTQALDVVGKTTSNSFIVKPQAGLAAPTGGSSPSAQWSTDGTHVWRATGNVGIGTATPASILHIENTSTSSPRNIVSDQVNAGTDGPQINTRKARGTPGSPAAVLAGDVLLNLAIWGHDGTSYATTANVVAYAEQNFTPSVRDSNLSFRTTSGTTTGERMRISSAGNVGIGTTNPTATLKVVNSTSNVPAFEINNSGTGSGDAMWVSNSSSTGRVLALHKTGGTGDIMQAYYDPGGGYQTRMTLTNAGAMWLASTLTQNSDRKLKENIVPISSALDKLAAIHGVTFEWKDKARGEGRQIGVIAQEAQEAFPELVSIDSDGFLGVNYPGLAAPLIEGVKELKADNDNLRAIVEQQGREIEALKAAR